MNEDFEVQGDRSPLLQVRGLKTYFYTEEGVVKAVDGVDFQVRRGEIFGLVGESGCGKSVTSLSVMGLIDPPGRVVEGEVLFDGISLLDLSESQMKGLRGARLSMIFQQPQSSLNPVFPIGDQVAEVFRVHRGMKRTEARDRSISLLKRVGIPDPAEKARAYPHEISGGQAQRVMIAMALALDPELLIADEPTTALDVTIQAQILELISDLTEERDMAVILITHDLGVVAEMCERVAVMYAGRIVEETEIEKLFGQSLHPYSDGLIASVPVLGRRRHRLTAVPGAVPNPVDLPSGCRFAPRCPARVEFGLSVCEEHEPELRPAGRDHTVRCWLYHDGPDHQAPLTETGRERSRNGRLDSRRSPNSG